MAKSHTRCCGLAPWLCRPRESHSLSFAPRRLFSILCPNIKNATDLTKLSQYAISCCSLSNADLLRSKNHLVKSRHAIFILPFKALEHQAIYSITAFCSLVFCFIIDLVTCTFHIACVSVEVEHSTIQAWTHMYIFSLRNLTGYQESAVASHNHTQPQSISTAYISCYINDVFMI